MKAALALITSYVAAKLGEAMEVEAPGNTARLDHPQQDQCGRCIQVIQLSYLPEHKVMISSFQSSILTEVVKEDILSLGCMYGMLCLTTVVGQSFDIEQAFEDSSPFFHPVTGSLRETTRDGVLFIGDADDGCRFDI